MFKPRLFLINGAQFGYSSGHFFYCKHLSSSFDISYICFDRGLNKLLLDGVNVTYVSFSGNKSKRIIRFLKECIRQSRIVKPQILFVTYFNICFLLPLFCKSEKSVLDIRTGSLKSNEILRRIENYIVLMQSFFFKRIVILSESLRQKLHISSSRSIVVPLGSEIISEENHNFDNISLLYVGALDKRNISQTISGFQKYLQNNNTICFKVSYTIIGFGAEAEILKITKCISENNLSELVKFVGRKIHEELVPYFEQSNIGIVFVPKTPWYDSQPVTKLFEYMLSGMPVIATNTYENRQIVNENNGVLITDSDEDFCNGLELIHERRQSYNSSFIRESVKEFTWENIVNNVLKPYLLKLMIQKNC